MVLLLHNEYSLMSSIKFYGSEIHESLAPFYFEFGNLLLTKIETTRDVISESASKISQ